MDEKPEQRKGTGRRRLMSALLFMLLAVGLFAAVAEAKKGHKGGAIVSCVTYGTGQVRIVRPPATCREGEYLMKWNIRGRDGADGAPGPPGRAAAISGPTRPPPRRGAGHRMKGTTRGRDAPAAPAAPAGRAEAITGPTGPPGTPGPQG